MVPRVFRPRVVHTLRVFRARDDQGEWATKRQKKKRCSLIVRLYLPQIFFKITLRKSISKARKNTLKIIKWLTLRVTSCPIQMTSKISRLCYAINDCEYTSHKSGRHTILEELFLAVPIDFHYSCIASLKSISQRSGY